MKKLPVLYLLFLLVGGQAQNAVRTETGTIESAGFKILIPENWNKHLVMFAHGYEFSGSPGKQSENPQFEGQMNTYLSRGFAVAASDYQYKGFVLPQAIDDTEALRQYFVRTYGKPDSTFIVGVSMGGGVAVATIEQFGTYYDGALPLCPLSSRPYDQVRKEFDMYATFNGLFPGVVPSLYQIFDLEKPFEPPTFAELPKEVQRIKSTIFQQDSLLAAAFARRFQLKPEDLPFSLFFNQNVLRDIAVKSGGNPFDNTNTVYSGFPDNLLVNRNAERMRANVDPMALFGQYDRTGWITRPVLLMHTLYDQLIPPDYGVTNFENMVHRQGKSQLFSVWYTNGQGHCAFQPEQIGRAFDALRYWVSTGAKVKPGFVE